MVKAQALSAFLPKVLFLGIYAPYNKTKNIDGYFEEFVSLAKSNELDTTHTMFIKIREIDPAYFITRGKLAEVKTYCDEQGIGEVVISEMLSAQQERNLRDFLHCRVFDRSQLILEIFEKAAHSAEGKLQVAIAMLHHKKSRVAGRGIHMSQQSGYIGLRAGPGETAKERELRHLENQILKLRKHLEQLEQVRATQRKQRLGANIPLICLIGYTNAGKSTILNALTKSDVLAQDRLFATLDTTTRELYLDSKKIGLISDTVGFIQNLPHNLIEAFKSTLAELQFANLLLVVVDSTDPNWEEHITVVHDVLKMLEVDKEVLYVFNKIDRLGDQTEHLLERVAAYQPNVLTCARSKDGLDSLKEYLISWSNRLPKAS